MAEILTAGEIMDQVLEIVEEREETEEQVLELSTEFLAQVGGGTGGVTI